MRGGGGGGGGGAARAAHRTACIAPAAARAARLRRPAHRPVAQMHTIMRGTRPCLLSLDVLATVARQVALCRSSGCRQYHRRRRVTFVPDDCAAAAPPPPPAAPAASSSIIISSSTTTTSRRGITSSAAAGDTGAGRRLFPLFAVYKGKAALQLKPIIPTWSASGVVEKEGRILVEVRDMILCGVTRR
jgi:hypothetical protein